MDTKQAIEYWKAFYDEIGELRHTPGTDPEEWDKQENATAAALEALVKQMPMDSEPGGYCPACGHKIIFQSHNFCGNCGQAIRRAE